MYQSFSWTAFFRVHKSKEKQSFNVCQVALLFFLFIKLMGIRNEFNQLVSVFSENYIFGKFDTFCKRLERIADVINTMEMFSGLGDVKIEGIDIITVKFKTICDAAKKKNYDILDHRKAEVLCFKL
jgi:hypothetical protein